MKKLIALISSLALMVSAVPFAVSAAEAEPAAYSSEELALFEKFDSGEVNVDINCDNVFDQFDTVDLFAYYIECKEGYDAETNEFFPPELWNTIAQYADVNLDGVLDIRDLGVLTNYYTRDNEWKNLKSSEIREHIFQYYDDSDGNDAIYNVDKVEILSAMFSNTNSRISDKTADASVNTESNVLGDANNDGKLTLADSVIIMQYIANPDKYPLTEQGKFNADIANTGDGITAADALEIQKML